MLEKKLNISLGISDFKALVTQNSFFIDKTLFIEEVINNGAGATLITRPPGWGKSLALDMLKTFLEIEVDEDGSVKSENSNRALFDGLNIAKETDYKQKKIIDVYQGRYPVIYVSFEDVIGDSYEEVLRQFKLLVQKTFSQYRYLSSSDKLHEWNKTNFARYLDGDFTKIVVEWAFKDLSNLLQKHHGRDVYILVDDYDKPIRYLLEKDLINNITEISRIEHLIIKSMGACGKGNHSLEKIILVGVLDIIRRTDFNNVITSEVDDRRFARSFGFNDDEVKKLVDQMQLGDASVIKNWYGGYNVSVRGEKTVNLHNPSSVMSYLSEVSKRSYYEPQKYSTHVETNMVFKNLLRESATHDLKDKFCALIQGREQIFRDYSSSIIDRDYGICFRFLFAYFLLSYGYLTISERHSSSQYSGSIPNYEMREAYRNAITEEIQGLTPTYVDSEFHHQLKHFMSSFDVVTATKIFGAILSKNVSKVEGLIQENQDINCLDQSYNLGFLHLATLSDDQEIFNAVVEYCGCGALTTKDNIANLFLLDYVTLSKNVAIKEQLNDMTEQQSISLVVPSYLQTLLCYEVWNRPIAPVLIGATILGAVIKTMLLGSPLLKVVGGMFVPFIGLATTRLEKTMDVTYCKDYSEYYSVNINSVPFNSLKQFLKYVLHHPEAYVTLENECSKDALQISRINVPMFRELEVSDAGHTITLCGHNEKIIQKIVGESEGNDEVGL